MCFGGFAVFWMVVGFVAFWWFASWWVRCLVHVGGLSDLWAVFGGTDLADLWLLGLFILVGTAGDIFLGGLI